MNKKSRRLLIFGLLLFCSVIVLALGLKYFPFTKVMKMPSAPEQAFVNPPMKQSLPPNTLYYDFEMAPGKETPDGFYKGIAHSGQYSVKAFGQNSFSIAVERTAAEIGVQNLKAVALSAWIYVFPTKNEVKGNMVFTASNELGVNVTWQGIGVLEPEVPQGKWFKVSKYFDLTSVPFKPDYKIQVYFWNNSRTDILIDDYTVIFGTPVDRRGDSAWVDMTKPGGFIPRFNYPPFQVAMLDREATGAATKLADISTKDKVIAGNFLNTGNDGLFVLRPDGRMTAYAFCSGSNEFRKISLSNQSSVGAILPVKKILKGKFLGNQADQVILSGDKGWMLCSLDPVTNPCNAAGTLQTSMKILWKSDSPAPSIYSGDFDADNRSEILVITNDGSWKVMAWESGGAAGGKCTVIATDDHEPVKVWVKADHETGISVGRFMPGINSDVVLNVTRRIGEVRCSYSLLRLNLSRKRWDPVYSEKQGYNGKIIGLDTLKPTDLFFTTQPGESRDVRVFRYNRDWRFDLKEIRFNDSTFRILSDVDFSGYDKDCNPKYYEALSLVPGYFTAPASCSFLVTGSVGKERNYASILPDFVHLYSVPTKKQP